MQPIILEGEVTIAAGSSVPNLIRAVPDLERYLRAPQDSPFWNAQIFAIASVAGVGFLDVEYGSKRVVDHAQLVQATNITNPYTLINGDWHPKAGDMLVLRGFNEDPADPITITFRVILEAAEQQETDTLVMQDSTVIAADAVPQHAFAGRQFETVEKPGLLTLFLSADDVGQKRSVYIEQTNIAPPSNIPATNRIPLDPDDESIDGIEVPQGKKQDLELLGTQGNVVFWRSAFKELA